MPSMTELLVFAILIAGVVIVIREIKSPKESLRWHHKFNKWVVENLSSLNACIFILLAIGFAIYGAEAAKTIGLHSYAGFILGMVFGLAVGFIYCGLFSLVLTFSKDISRIANAIDKKSDE